MQNKHEGLGSSDVIVSAPKPRPTCSTRAQPTIESPKYYNMSIDDTLTDTREALIAVKRKTMSMPVSRVPKGCVHIRTQCVRRASCPVSRHCCNTNRVHHDSVEAVSCKDCCGQVGQGVVDILRVCTRCHDGVRGVPKAFETNF